MTDNPCYWCRPCEESFDLHDPAWSFFSDDMTPYCPNCGEELSIYEPKVPSTDPYNSEHES